MAMLNATGYIKITGVLNKGLLKAQSRTISYGRTYGEGYREGIVDLTTQLADLFEHDSRNFDRRRFYNDVGISIPMEEDQNGKRTS